MKTKAEKIAENLDFEKVLTVFKGADPLTIHLALIKICKKDSKYYPYWLTIKNYFINEAYEDERYFEPGNENLEAVANMIDSALWIRYEFLAH